MASSDPLYDRIKQHLQEVHVDPQRQLDAKLLEQLGTQASDGLSIDRRKCLVNLVASLLQNVQQDPEPATKLAENLARSFRFSDVQEIDPPVDLVAGLEAPSAPVQLLTIRLIGLAAQTASDVAFVAANIDLVRTLVNTWLRTTSIAIAESAETVLTSLLLADTDPKFTPGLMQRRLFKDRDIYNLFFSLPSLQNVGREGQPPRKDKTIAQGRVFSFVGRVWHLQEVWDGQIPEIEKEYGLKNGQGLVHYISLQMIDVDDILLRRTQIGFFTDLIRNSGLAFRLGASSAVIEATDRKLAASKILNFLKDNEIHQRLLSLYTRPEDHDPVDASFLHSSAAAYVVEYLLNHRDDFMSHPAVKQGIFNRLLKSIGETQASQWSRNDGPKDDLNVLVSVPFLSLAADASYLLLLPTRPPSADVFRCLRRLFSGDGSVSLPTEVAFPNPTPAASTNVVAAEEGLAAEADQWASRCLYIRYTTAQPRFWANLVAASTATALKDTAIAAIDLMTSIIRARWRTQMPAGGAGVEVPASTLALLESPEVPDSGLAAIMHPTVLDLVVPFLMKGPNEGRAINLLGADTESAEYHVARAKLELTRALKEGIEEMVGNLGSDDKDKALLTELAAGLGVLLRQGVSRQSDEPGAEVGTMEL